MRSTLLFFATWALTLVFIALMESVAHNHKLFQCEEIGTIFMVAIIFGWIPATAVVLSEADSNKAYKTKDF